MSTRVMIDGRPYPRSEETQVRPYHKPEPGQPSWRCAVCGSTWHWARRKDGTKYTRHDPGTFWRPS